MPEAHKFTCPRCGATLFEIRLAPGGEGSTTDTVVIVCTASSCSYARDFAVARARRDVPDDSR